MPADRTPEAVAPASRPESPDPAANADRGTPAPPATRKGRTGNTGKARGGQAAPRVRRYAYRRS
jgi:hypothetical protein